MASKTTLNTRNLERLGARRLAELLIEISQGDAATKRRLRLELAGNASAGDVAREVRKRLTTLERSRSFVDWPQSKALIKDLETQRRAIVEQVGKDDPAAALELMWRFLGLAGSIFERCDDSSGTVIEVFHGACEDLGALAEAADVSPDQLAERAFAALNGNDHGQFDDLIPVLTPQLGERGLEHLKAMMIELSEQPPARPAQDDRQVIGWSSGGPIYADELEERRRESMVQLALQQIADAQGDVDSYIAQFDEAAQRVPRLAAEIARRLLAVGRPEDALAAVDAVDRERPGWLTHDWEEARAEVLGALGRAEDAQLFRWRCFERSLSETHLRAYLKRLPDFDDVEAEEGALDHAAGYRSFHVALAFLVNWPALDRAARLVLDRAQEIDGDRYEVLTPAAEALEERHPLAATMLRRAMIDFALDQARVKRYRHAARHFQECASAAATVEDFGGYETHGVFEQRLRSKHGRKSAFWSLLD